MITRSMFAATLAATTLVACVQADEAPTELKRAIPTADQVAIKLPGSHARAIGDLADWYVATRHVTLMFNGGSAWVLALVHTIVQFPVTSTSGDTYTWGPWSAALDPAEYKLDVRDVGDGTYEYRLSGRSKLVAGAPFEVIIDGTADPRPGALRGRGTFLLDFDAGGRINPIDTNDARGTLSATYDLGAHRLALAIDTTDEHGEPVVADYAYRETADGGGDMVFDFQADAGGTPAPERVTLRSRWLATGAGRADGRLIGGDLGTTGAIASECWDTRFARVYYTDSVDFAPTEGDPAACVFATPDLPPAL